MGVLCSVDVAVIIFGEYQSVHTQMFGFLISVVDEKPGHQQKLYEYSSSRIKDIVKRHAGVRSIIFFASQFD